MTNKAAIERWATVIVPAVFKAETQLQREHPEWIERIKNITPEDGHRVAKAYCTAIAEIIVRDSKDYNPNEP